MKAKKEEIDVEELLKDQNWKYRNKKYLFELEKFLDIAENIQDEKNKKNVIGQMLKCDKTLTTIAEEVFEKIKEKK